MAQLSLSQEQATALADLLDRVLGDLSVEIADTDLKSFRDNLKLQRDHLKAVREQLNT